MSISGSDIISPEFGWSSRRVELRDCSAQSEYFFLRGEELDFSGLRFQGKYSFQYIKNARFDHCVFDTKDAFWHAQGLTLVRCRLIGTQPLCYCKGLKLVDCEMVDTDLSFEKSEVEATVTAPIVSVKNPRSGAITAPGVGELIMDDPEAQGRVIIVSPADALPSTHMQ